MSKTGWQLHLRRDIGIYLPNVFTRRPASIDFSAIHTHAHNIVPLRFLRQTSTSRSF